MDPGCKAYIYWNQRPLQLNPEAQPDKSNYRQSIKVPSKDSFVLKKTNRQTLFILGSVFCFTLCAFMSVTLHCRNVFGTSVFQWLYNHTAHSLIFLNGSKNPSSEGEFNLWEIANIISGKEKTIQLHNTILDKIYIQIYMPIKTSQSNTEVNSKANFQKCC